MWKKIAKFFSHPIIQWLGLPVILAMITWIVTELAKLPIWEIWLAIVFIIGCAFWILNQVSSWREKHKKGFSKLSDKEIERTIREWVDIPGFTFKRLDVDENESYFVFSVTDYDNHPINITRSKKHPHDIMIWADISVAPKPDVHINLTDERSARISGEISSRNA